MKTKFLSNMLLIAGSLFFSSRSCESDSTHREDTFQQARQDSLIQEFIRVFGSDYLSDEQLALYEERGKQKLKDFTDLLSLYSNQELDTVFRIQIRNSLMNFFLDADAQISLWPVDFKPAAGPVYLSDLLCGIETSPYTSVRYEIKQLKVIEPLHADSQTRYTGSLAGIFMIFGISGKDTLFTRQTVKHARLLVTKTRKSFGSTMNQDVWQVFLDGLK
jgi:hypothetical protein